MDQDSSPTGEAVPGRRKMPYVRRVFLALVLVLVAAGALVWFQRDQIAQKLITDTLDGYGVQATYRIDSIGPDAQVLSNIVIGDPAQPDMTIERAELRLTARFGLPGVSRLILVKPRLYGTVIDGQPSFGALDPLIFTGSDAPFELPDLNLELVDGRALIEGDYGPVGLRLDGSGNLRGGFAGELAATAPQLHLPGCEVREATVFGAIAVAAQRPQFTGPLRFGSLDCAGAGLAINGGAAQLDLQAETNLVDFGGQADLQARALSLAGGSMSGLSGSGHFTLRSGDLTSDYALQGRNLITPTVQLAVLDAAGSVKAREGFARIEVDSQINGTNLLLGSQLGATIDSAAQAGEGTLAAPLLRKLGRQLALATRGSTLAANLTARREGDRISLVVPEAQLRSRNGESLLALSRGQLALGNGGVPLFSGNIATGGTGLPQIAGRMEQSASGALELRLRMQDYAAGDAHLALPEMRLRQARSGALTLDGVVEASGPLPGGFAQGLSVPVSGTVSASGAVAMWSACTPISFDNLHLASLQITRQRLTLCPPGGSSILRYDGRGLTLAAGAPSLSLAGTLGETPVRLQTGAVGMAWPGALSVKAVDVQLGPQGSASKFTLTDLSAVLGSEIAGQFSGADVRMDAVPLEILQAGGNWRFANGVLSLENTQFTLQDRQDPARFKPLLAHDAVLTMADSVINSSFILNEPNSGERVVQVALAHNLTDASGHADLKVAGLTFRDGFQPYDLTENMRGVVSSVRGAVSGTGRIDWNADAITSGGTFATDSLDMAAPFGPVAGVSGTVVFTDLLGLTTAPHQRLKVRSINPGIEVNDGEMAISMVGGTKVTLEEAQWPFMGGTLTMHPITVSVGAEEVRRYVLEIVGLDAQSFIDHMEMGNIAADGTFDGTIPVVFDEMGNGSLEDGLLISRPPGGTVSYIGELTYEDLTPIANYAFDALRALQYDQMRIEMNGSLIGELVTSVRFDGVRQGPGAQDNFVTRQIANRIARLPIRFIVNVRAPFYSMMGSIRSLYDPSAVIDPRTLNLLADDGTRFVPATRPDAPPRSDEPHIQPPESEAMP